MSPLIHRNSSVTRETPCKKENNQQKHKDHHFRELAPVTGNSEQCKLTPTQPKRPTWTVMGSWCLHTKLVRTLQPKNIIIHLLVTLLLLTSVNCSLHRRMRHCQVDKCSKDYRSISTTSDDTEKCRLLLSHRQCLSHMRVSCRGNLLYHTSVHINKEKMKKLQCSNLLQNLSTTTTKEPVTNNNDRDMNSCSYAGKPKYRFCSLFGDPHVRTFSDKFYTCRANGSWPLVNNDYLEVTATNTLVDGGMEATAISKLSVVIKDSGDCAEKKSYTAVLEAPLPVVFDDGSADTGLEKSVKISEIVAGKEVQIDIRFIATTLVIRHVGSHLSFSVQMPQEIVDSPVEERLQMCVRGCPKRQRIPLSREIDRLTKESEQIDIDGKRELRIIPKYTEQEARKRCRDALLDDEDVNHNTERSKRSAGKKTANNSKNPKRSINHRQHRNVDLDPAATTWQQLSSGTKFLGDIKSFSTPHHKRNKKQNRHSSNRRKKGRHFNLMSDEPRPRSSKKGKGGNKNNNIRSVKRGANFYFEACVFDLMTTGDIMYTSSARGAFEDVTRFHEAGANAPSSSLDVVTNWIPETTDKPRTDKTNLLRENVTPVKKLPETTTGSGTSQRVDVFVLLICLLSSLFSLNFLNNGVYFQGNNIFFKSRGIKT